MEENTICGGAAYIIRGSFSACKGEKLKSTKPSLSLC